MYLEVNETAQVVFGLMNRDLSYWNVYSQSWELAAGDVGVEVGWWVGDVQLEGTIAMA